MAVGWGGVNSDTFGQVCDDVGLHQLAEELLLLGDVVCPRLWEKSQETKVRDVIRAWVLQRLQSSGSTCNRSRGFLCGALGRGGSGAAREQRTGGQRVEEGGCMGPAAASSL